MIGSTTIKNRSGQGTVENLMLTAILAAVLLPIVYKQVLVPLLNTYKQNRGQLVEFVSQNKKTTVPSGWFASERMAQLKEPKKIGAPDELNPDDLPEPGQSPESDGLKEPDAIQSRPLNEPKSLKEPDKLNPKSLGGPGGAGSGSQGKGSAMGSGSQDPDFFGNKTEGGAKTEGQSGPGDGSAGRGGVSGGDEYSPNGRVQAGGIKGEDKGQQSDRKKSDSSIEGKSKKNLALNETREAEQSRSSPFDWWLLIKILIIGLIIFLLILIGLSNLKKR